MTPKFFTADEANRLLPTLEPLMRRLQAKRQQLRERQQTLEEFRARASRDGGVVPGSDVADAKTESARLLTEIQEGAQQIESWGCVVKDLDRGPHKAVLGKRDLIGRESANPLKNNGSTVIRLKDGHLVHLHLFTPNIP